MINAGSDGKSGIFSNLGLNFGGRRSESIANTGESVADA